jgi:hypothetical protein
VRAAQADAYDEAAGSQSTTNDNASDQASAPPGATPSEQYVSDKFAEVGLDDSALNMMMLLHSQSPLQAEVVVQSFFAAGTRVENPSAFIFKACKRELCKYR